MFNKMAFHFFATEEIANRSQIGEFNVELNETGNISFCFRCVDTSFIAFKIKEYW